MSQYIITSINNKKVLATSDYSKAYEFVLVNQDARFRTVDYTGKTKIMTKQLFLKNYYSKEENKGKLFVLIQILIKQKTAISALISEMKLNTEYKEFKASL